MSKLQLPEKLQGLIQPTRYKIMHGGRGGGKCLAKGTKVIMSNGMLKPVEDIMIGDEVMSPSGVNTVRGITTGVSQMYKVHQTSGIDYVVNGDHILTLKKSDSAEKDGRYKDYPKIVNISVKEWLNKSKRWREHFRGFKVPWNVTNDFDLKLPPYFVGLWIGDGSKENSRITSMDEEVIEYCKDLASTYNRRVHLYKKKGQKASTICFSSLHGKSLYKCDIHKRLESLGLIHNKHIPYEYMNASEEDRLELLAGLIDSDGSYNQKNYSFSQKDENIAKRFKQIADSLGFRTSIVHRYNKCNGESRSSITGERFSSYRVTIGGDLWRIPCKIKRKQSFNLKKNKDWRLSQISVDPVNIGEYHGFELDGDHLFLLEDGTVTHNSHSVASLLVLLGSVNKLRIVCAREVQNSIKQSVHQLLSDKIEQMGLQAHYNILNNEIRGVNGTTFDFVGLRQTSIDSFKSFEGVDIVWIEEGQSVSKRSWDTLIPTVRKQYSEIWTGFIDGYENSSSEIWVTFNPFLYTDDTYQRFVVKPPESSWVVKINWNDNPWFPDVLEQERKHLKEVDPDNYMNVWEGEPLSASDMQFISSDVVDEAMKRVPRYLDDDPLICGIDLARGGGDDCFISFRRGLDAKSEKVYKIGAETSRDSMRVVSMITRILEDHQPDVICTDEGSIGGPISDRLNQLGWDSIPISFGSRAIDHKHYGNRVTEMWDRMRKWLQQGGAIINNERLKNELVNREYKHDGQDRLLLEKKSDMKKRGIHSCDWSDSICLTFAVDTGGITRGYKNGLIGQRKTRQWDYDPLDVKN